MSRIFVLFLSKICVMIVTFKPVVINRRKDGTWPVKIRVTFKGVSRRLPTTLSATSADLTRGGRIKSADLLNKADAIVRQMREAAAKISPFDLEEWDVDRVVRFIKDDIRGGDNFRLDFFSFADGFTATKGDGTRRDYATAVNALERFVGRRELDVNDITRAMLLDFVDYVNAEPWMRRNNQTGELVRTSRAKKRSTAAAKYLARLGAIYQAARVKYNDEDEGRIVIPRQPFALVKVKASPSEGQRNLGEELMQRIIAAQPADKGQRYALAAFVVSFALMGANLADLYDAKRFSGDVWRYHRRKTRTRRADAAAMQVVIQPEVRRHLAVLQDWGHGDWWLPRLHRLGSTTNLCTQNVNYHLRRWAEADGVEPFTFYAARHTWASIARKAGVEKATVDECLCHVGDFAITDIYAERSWDIIAAANRKVLDLFNW